MSDSNELVGKSELRQRRVLLRLLIIMFVTICVSALVVSSFVARRIHLESQLVHWVKLNNERYNLDSINFFGYVVGIEQVQCLPTWAGYVPFIDRFATREIVTSFCLQDCMINKRRVKLIESANYLVGFVILSNVDGLEHLCGSKSLQRLWSISLLECDVPPGFFIESMVASNVSFTQMEVDQSTIESVLQLPNLKSIDIRECRLPVHFENIEQVDLNLRSVWFDGAGSSESALALLPFMNSPNMTVRLWDCRCNSKLVDYICTPKRCRKIWMNDVEISYSNARKVLLHSHENHIFFNEEVPSSMLEEEFLSLTHEFPDQFIGPGNPKVW